MEKNAGRQRRGKNKKKIRIIRSNQQSNKQKQRRDPTTFSYDIHNKEKDSAQLIPVEFGENGIEELGSDSAPLVEPASSTFAGIENLSKLINKLHQIEERLPRIQLDSLEKYQQLLQQIGGWVERNVPSQHKDEVLWRVAELIDRNPYYRRHVSGVNPNVTFKQTIFREGGVVARKVIHRNGREVVEAFATPSFAMPGSRAPATLEVGRDSFKRQSIHRETLEDKLGGLGKIWIPIRKLGEGGGFGYPVEVELDWNAVKELPIKELYEFWLKATAQYHKDDLKKKKPVEAWRNSLVEQLIALLQGKEFVAKLFFPERIKDEWSLNKCRKEARILCDIRHPNVIPAYDFVVDEHSPRFEQDKIFYVMEKADEKLPEKGRLPRRKAVEIVLEAAYGVRELHRRGIIHRDIKPANIMILNGRAVILDPGLAKGGTDYSLEEVSTKTGAIAGTPAFMSPEQAQSTKHVDEKADVYSLGATLYRLVTGRDPYTGEDALVILRQVVDETKKPLPLSSFGINDPGLQAIIDGSMEKNVDFRMDLDGFISASEIYLSLDIRSDPRQATKSIKTLVPSVPVGVKLGRKFKKLLGWAGENIAKAVTLALVSISLVAGGVGYCIKIRSEKQSRFENVVQLLERADTEFRNKNYGFIIDAKNDWEEKVRLAKEYGFDLSDEEKKFNELYSLAKVGKVIKETYLTGLEHIRRGEFSKGIDLLKKFIDESKSIDKNASLELNLHKKLKDAKEKLDQALIEILNEDYRFLKRTVNRAEQDSKRVRLDELKEDLEQRQKAYRTFIRDTWEQVKIYNKDINEFAKKVEEKIKEFEQYSELRRLRERLKETRTLEDKIFSFFEQRVIEQIEKADREKRYVDEVEWMKAMIEFYRDLIKNNEVSERLRERLEERISEWKNLANVRHKEIFKLAIENAFDDNYNGKLSQHHFVVTDYIAQTLLKQGVIDPKTVDKAILKERIDGVEYLIREELWRTKNLVKYQSKVADQSFPRYWNEDGSIEDENIKTSVYESPGYYLLMLTEAMKLAKEKGLEELYDLFKKEYERRCKTLEARLKYYRETKNKDLIGGYNLVFLAGAVDSDWAKKNPKVIEGLFEELIKPYLDSRTMTFKWLSRARAPPEKGEPIIFFSEDLYAIKMLSFAKTYFKKENYKLLYESAFFRNILTGLNDVFNKTDFFDCSFSEAMLAYALQCKKFGRLYKIKILDIPEIRRSLNDYFNFASKLTYSEKLDAGGLLGLLSLAEAIKGFKPKNSLLERALAFLLQRTKSSHQRYCLVIGSSPTPNEEIIIKGFSPYGKWRTFTGFGSYLNYLRDHYNSR